MSDQDDDADFAADEAARIAALHQSAPEVIWLQVDPEAEQFDGWEAQTWCSDRINATDVEYIKADKVKKLTDAARQALDVLEDLDEMEMARLRGRADEAIASLLKALKP